MNIYDDSLKGTAFAVNETEEYKSAHDLSREDVYAQANSEITRAQQIIRSFWYCIVALVGVLAVEYAIYMMAFETVISATNEFFRRFTLIGIVALLAAHILVLALGARAERFVNFVAIASILLFLPSIALLVTKSLMAGGYLDAEGPALTGNIDWSSLDNVLIDSNVSGNAPVWLETGFRVALPVALTTGLLLSLYASVWLIRRILVEIPRAKRVVASANRYIALNRSLRTVEEDTRDLSLVKADKEAQLAELTEGDLVAELIGARDKGLQADIAFVKKAMMQGARHRYARVGDRDPRLVREAVMNVLKEMNDEYVSEAVRASRLNLEAEGSKA